MKVFITGTSGFLGSHFLRSLLESKRHEIAVLLRNPNTADRVRALLPQVKVISGDLAHQQPIEAPLRDFQPDAFVHFAWKGVMGGDRNSAVQWRNVPETLELVELAARVGAKHWIGLGSQAEYGACQNRIDEQVQTKPSTLYGASKLAACILSQRLCQELDLRHAWLRIFSSFGPNDNAEWMIPYLVKTLLNGDRPSLTAAEQMWDYIYVEDAAAAVISVLEEPKAEGVFNLGSGSAQKLRFVVESIRNLIDDSLPLGFGEVPYRPDQVMNLEADISRLRAYTGWQPSYSFETAIRKTVNWYQNESRSPHKND